jgi:hypothetical protein
MTEEKKITIEVVKTFKFAHRGCDVVEYPAGETVEVSERCAEVALGEKWARPVKSGKAKAEAPENKDAGATPENKAAE